MTARSAFFFLIFILGCCRSIPAKAEEVHRPQYELQFQLSTDLRQVQFQQTIEWHNNTTRATDLIVIHFFPGVSTADRPDRTASLALERLLIPVDETWSQRSSRGTLSEVRQVLGAGNQKLNVSRHRTRPGVYLIDLPRVIRPGEALKLSITGRIPINEIRGGWGFRDGTGQLLHAFPTIAHFDNGGWHPAAFVPWAPVHQAPPGHWKVSGSVPDGLDIMLSTENVVQSGGEITGKISAKEIALSFARSRDEQNFTLKLDSGRSLKLTILLNPLHRRQTTRLVRFSEALLNRYEKWLGPFPYSTVSLAEGQLVTESDSAGNMIFLDERILDLPLTYPGYLELVLAREWARLWWGTSTTVAGFDDPFLDQGLAEYLAQRHLDEQRGVDHELTDWSNARQPGVRIYRNNLRWASVLDALRGRSVGSAKDSLADIPSVKDFRTGAVARGATYFRGLEQRLGKEAFFTWLAQLYLEKQGSVVQKQDLIKHLEDRTALDWQLFTSEWLDRQRTIDYQIDQVIVAGIERKFFYLRASRRPPRRKRRTTLEVDLSFTGKMLEPTELAVSFARGDQFPLRIPIDPVHHTKDVKLPNDITITRLGDRSFRVRMVVDEEPESLVLDPRRVLPDPDVRNNIWPRVPSWDWRGFYSLFDDLGETNEIDRWNFNSGIWIWGSPFPDPWYTRGGNIGVRLSTYRTARFSGGLYSAFRLDYQDLVLGAEGLLKHTPFPRTEIGFNFEQRIAGPFFRDLDGERLAQRGSIFARYSLEDAPAEYLQPRQYVELFSAYTGNFLPFARERGLNSERPQWTWLSGLHYRLNQLTPYWDAESGFWLDLLWGAGPVELAKRSTTQQLSAEFSFVRTLADDLGFFSKTRLVSRIHVQGAWPGRGDFFSLGGSRQLRGFDLKERQGNFLWFLNLESRTPILQNWNRELFDQATILKNAQWAMFYDVGGIYSQGERVGAVAHALGIGLRINSTHLQVFERTTFRLDLAKTLNAASPFQLWFGLFQPF